MEEKTLSELRELKAKMYAPEYKHWGNALWHYLHIYANTHEYTNDFGDTFALLIPCGSCRTEFQKSMKPKDGESMAEWAFNLHNRVNKDLGKKIFTKEDYEKRYGKKI